MSRMEPERKSEKLLRAYAKKRRADAGDAFKLHPATRRMLQGEVARRVRKSDATTGSPSLWNWLRARWVLPLGFALLVCLGAVVFWPTAAPEQSLAFRSVAPAVATKELPAPVAPPPSIAGVNNGMPLPAPVAAPPAQATTFAAGSTELAAVNPSAPSLKDDRQATTTFAATDADRSQRREIAVTSAAPPVASPAGNFARESATILPPIAGEPVGVAPAADLAQSVPPGSVSGATASESFAPAKISGTLRAAKAVPAASAAKFKSEAATDLLQLNATKNSQRFVQVPMKKNLPVLASFELQQNGNQISVVDHDGSIYNGTLQPTAPANEDLAKTRPGEKLGASQLKQQNFGTVNSQQLASQNYFFRVSGANRRLKQNVVFSGNLLPISNAPAGASQKFQNIAGGSGGGTQSKVADANAAQAQQLFSNSRIEGTVTIGRTAPVEIKASPVTP